MRALYFALALLVGLAGPGSADTFNVSPAFLLSVRLQTPPVTCAPISPPSGGIYDSTSLSGSGTTGGAFTAANAASPDCLVNGSTFVEDSSTGTHLITAGGNAQIVHTFTAQSATVTVYVKQGAGTRNIEVTMFNSGFSAQSNLIINPITGAVLVTNCSFAAATLTQTVTLGQNGYTKITMTTTPITTTGVWIQLGNISGTSTSYAGDGTSSLIWWGLGLTTP